MTKTQANGLETWCVRIPDKDEVRGSSPRGPTTQLPEKTLGNGFDQAEDSDPRSHS
jgi:hypothetical protein